MNTFRLDDLINKELTFKDLKNTEVLIEQLTPVLDYDIRNVGVQLQLLLDILEQVADYSRISNPAPYIQSLEQSIEVKKEGIVLLEKVDAFNDTLLSSYQEQLDRDNELMDSGLLAQNDYDKSYTGLQGKGRRGS